MKKILFATDMDGTLLSDDKTISQENLAAIEAFGKRGGIFTIATGRSFLSASRYLKQLNLSVPLIVFNGSAIYDLKTEKELWSQSLPDHSYAYVQDVAEHFPLVGIEVLKDRHIYVPTYTNMIAQHVDIEQLEYTRCSMDKVPFGCVKALFAAPKEIMDQLIEYIMEKGYTDVDFSRSDEKYYEMLPKGVSKGLAFQKLCELLHIDIADTIAIGDYNNDIEMIKTAHLGVAVKNAPQEVRDAADLVTVSNNDHAVAVVLNQIMESM